MSSSASPGAGPCPSGQRAVGDKCEPRKSHSKRKPDDSSPYSSGDLNQPWPAGITPIPRATTNWESAPSMEMTEGSSTRALMDKKHQSNGLVL
ncbi:hypothetical protein INR49_005559 [Caranx melampygus]|nr:hypothetical protein INR49_005559 [Caranx melampygus]